MIYLNEYKEANDFSQQTCVIMAPGISLVKDIYNLPEYNYLLGLNHHTQILKPDAVVALDRHTVKTMPHFQGFLMGKYEEADIHIGQCPSFGHSGSAAVWVANYLGFKRIILAGFDCYMHPERSYWHDCTLVKKPKIRTCWDQQRMQWEIVKASVKGGDNIEVMSGVLTKIFKEYSSAER